MDRRRGDAGAVQDPGKHGAGAQRHPWPVRLDGRSAVAGQHVRVGYRRHRRRLAQDPQLPPPHLYQCARAGRRYRLRAAAHFPRAALAPVLPDAAGGRGGVRAAVRMGHRDPGPAPGPRVCRQNDAQAAGQAVPPGGPQDGQADVQGLPAVPGTGRSVLPAGAAGQCGGQPDPQRVDLRDHLLWSFHRRGRDVPEGMRA
ncbi:hypothetical protein D3C71_1438360 [compost metagenome]